jgi:hypothetical protein
MYNYKHRKKKRCGQLKAERVEWPWPGGDQATAAVPSMSSTYRPIEDDSSPEYHSGELTLFGTSEVVTPPGLALYTVGKDDL